jgi:peptide/nickel transport system permease protein
MADHQPAPTVVNVEGETPLMLEDVDRHALEPGFLRGIAKKRRRRQIVGWVGIALVALVLLSTVFGPMFLDTDPNLTALDRRLLPPLSTVDGTTYLLGTDSVGRDMLARVLYGGRASLGVVAMALAFGATLGLVLGIVSGYYGGWLDNIVMRLVDTQLALPTLIAAMFVAALLGTGYFNTALTLGIAGWPSYARLVRGEVLKVREEDYVAASTALGSTDLRLLFSHIAPNILSSFVVVASLEVGKIILQESSLSFLGFGMQPPNPSWGSMIRQGNQFLSNAWWMSAVPGVAIVLTTLGFNLMGDWLRDRLDPQAD